MYGCESWTVKKAECQRIDAFEVWCWRRLLRIPWSARRFNQSILKEISPGISLEGMMLKLKLRYFVHLMRRVESLEKTLMLGGTPWKRLWCWKGRTEDEMAGWHHWLDGRESGWTPGVGDGQGGLVCCDSWGSKESDTTDQLNWTELNWHTHVRIRKHIYSHTFFFCLRIHDEGQLNFLSLKVLKILLLLPILKSFYSASWMKFGHLFATAHFRLFIIVV